MRLISGPWTRGARNETRNGVLPGFALGCKENVQSRETTSRYVHMYIKLYIKFMQVALEKITKKREVRKQMNKLYTSKIISNLCIRSRSWTPGLRWKCRRDTMYTRGRLLYPCMFLWGNHSILDSLGLCCLGTYQQSRELQAESEVLIFNFRPPPFSTRFISNKLTTS